MSVKEKAAISTQTACVLIGEEEEKEKEKEKERRRERAVKFVYGILVFLDTFASSRGV